MNVLFYENHLRMVMPCYPLYLKRTDYFLD